MQPPRWTSGVFSLCILLSELAFSFEVTGTPGGSVSLVFDYQQKYLNDNKYWYREGYQYLETSQYQREMRLGRFSAMDDVLKHTLTLTITNLQQADAGVYVCAINVWGFDTLNRNTLIVLPARSMKVKVTGNLGQYLLAPCRYPAGYENHVKYWSRDDYETVHLEASQSQRQVILGRVSVWDDVLNRNFRMAIEDLQHEDTGIYKCGLSICCPDPIVTASVTVLHGPTNLTPTQKAGNVSGSVATESFTKATSTIRQNGFVNLTTESKTMSRGSSYNNQTSSTGSSPSESLLPFVLPAALLLLLLLLVITVFYVKANQKRREAEKANTLPNYEDTRLSDMESTGHPDVSYATIHFEAQNQIEQQIYANVELTLKNPSAECEYSVVKKT